MTLPLQLGPISPSPRGTIPERYESESLWGIRKFCIAINGHGYTLGIEGKKLSPVSSTSTSIFVRSQTHTLYCPILITITPLPMPI